MNIYGVKVNINFFTWVFLFFFVVTGYFKEMFFIILTVLIHELSHIYAAKKVGIDVLQLDIYPFGGTAILDSIVFIRPDLEIIIALSGPISNIFFSFLIIFISQLMNINLEYLIKFNVIMAAFNLLPGLPLDGGRVLKSILAHFIGFYKAVLITVYSSYFIGIIILYYSILYNINDIKYIYSIFGIILIIAAKKEINKSKFLHIRNLLYKKSEFHKKGSMTVNTIAVLETEKIHKIINNFIPGKYHVIIIVDKDLKEKLRINETELFEYAIKDGLNSTIGDILKS